MSQKDLEQLSFLKVDLFKLCNKNTSMIIVKERSTAFSEIHAYRIGASLL